MRRWIMWGLITVLGCGGSSMSYGGGAEESSDVGYADVSHGGGGEAAEPSFAGGDGAGAVATGAPAADSATTARVQARASVSLGGATGATEGAPAVTPVAPTTVATPTTVTTTTTTTVTVEVDTPPMIHEPEPEIPQQQLAPVQLLTAASVGDHDRRGNYLHFLSRHPFEVRNIGLDMSRRVRFKVVDSQGRAVNDAQITIHDARQQAVQGRTHGDGRWDFFPGVMMPRANGSMVATITANRVSAQVQVHVPHQGDGQDITVRLANQQQQAPRTLDLGFLIDVTGSMEDELRYVNSEVASIVERVRSEAPEVTVRVGAVFYRDRNDSLPLQRIAFTQDVAGFARAMQQIRASGGGDYPEDVNAGLQTAFNGLSWSQGNAARVLVVIADAPPKRYSTQFTYREAMIAAAQRGIRILPVAASGSNRQVEVLFRAMGTFTSTPYVYLTDDSGIGNAHQEADTDRVAVEYFNDLLTRLMISDVRGWGMHEPGSFGAAS